LSFDEAEQIEGKMERRFKRERERERERKEKRERANKLTGCSIGSFLYFVIGEWARSFGTMPVMTDL
jgi:hypothetical protein